MQIFLKWIKNKIKKNKGFTLTETMSVIIIIGIISALTMPSVIKRQIKLINITKIEESMKLYADIVNRIVIDNKIYNNNELIKWILNENKNNCSKSSIYFKSIDGSGCVFKVSSGIWWDISDISKPLVSIKDISSDEALHEAKQKASDEKNNTAFYFSARYDNDGHLRVNDNAFEHAYPNDAETFKNTEKIYNYIYSN